MDLPKNRLLEKSVITKCRVKPAICGVHPVLRNPGSIKQSFWPGLRANRGRGHCGWSWGHGETHHGYRHQDLTLDAMDAHWHRSLHRSHRAHRAHRSHGNGHGGHWGWDDLHHGGRGCRGEPKSWTRHQGGFGGPWGPEAFQYPKQLCLGDFAAGTHRASAARPFASGQPGNWNSTL